VETNIDFLRNVLAHEDFRAGRAHTGWLEQVLPDLV
jgi:biotin carboxylase